MIFYRDGEIAISFGLEFDNWVVQYRFIIKKSPPHTQDQNGPAKRSRGVIIRRAKAMKNTANLPKIL
jgi:hypothetical protein